MFFPRRLMPLTPKKNAPDSSEGTVDANDFNRIDEETRAIQANLGGAVLPPGPVYEAQVDPNSASNADEGMLLNTDSAGNVLSLIARLIDKANNFASRGILVSSGYANSGQRIIFPEEARATFLTYLPLKSDSTITVSSTDGFPDSGIISILNDATPAFLNGAAIAEYKAGGATNVEWIRYSSKSSTQFMGCQRGYHGTTVGPHQGYFGTLDQSSDVSRNLGDHCVPLPDEVVYCSRRYPAWRSKRSYFYPALNIKGSLVEMTRRFRLLAGKMTLSAQFLGAAQLALVKTQATTLGILQTRTDGSLFLQSATPAYAAVQQLSWSEASAIMTALLAAGYASMVSGENDLVVPQLAIPVFAGKMGVQNYVAGSAIMSQNSVMVVQTADARLYLASLPTMTLAEGVAGYETMFVASPATQEESA